MDGPIILVNQKEGEIFQRIGNVARNSFFFFFKWPLDLNSLDGALSWLVMT